MKIKYTGLSGVRVIGEVVWNAGNGFVAEVSDPELVANLLTYPTGEFEAVEPVDTEAVLAFVEGDERPAEEISKKNRRHHKPSLSEEE